jgi:hypothetical protein
LANTASGSGAGRIAQRHLDVQRPFARLSNVRCGEPVPDSERRDTRVALKLATTISIGGMMREPALTLK